MTEQSMEVSLPLDRDGFLRRECPHCERQFKWLHTTDTDQSRHVEQYFCPLCHEPASLSRWLTKEQAAYIRDVAAAEILGPQLHEWERLTQGLNRPGGLIQLNVKVTVPPRPETLVEANDMVRVDCPCHPEEPIKVPEDWQEEVACLICGICYPVDLLRALPRFDEKE